MKSSNNLIIQGGMLMLSMSGKERIAIEVGSHWTKVIVGASLGKKKKNGLVNEHLRIREVFFIKTPKAQMPESDMMDLDDRRYVPAFDKFILVREVREMLRERRIKTEKVIITLDDRSVISREMVLPKVDKDKLKGIVSLELQEYLPIDPQRYIIDFKIMEVLKVGEIEKYNLNVAALQKDEGEFYQSFVHELRKDAFAMDLTSNSISKLFDRNMKINGKLREIESKTIAYVDIGYSNVNLHIIEHGVLKFTRNIEGGMGPLSSANDTRILNGEESLALIRKWVSSLEQMIRFFTSREADREIDQVFIYGGGAMIPDIEAHFSEIMGTPTEIIKNLDNLDIHKDLNEFSLPLYLNTVAALIRR